MEWKDFKYIFAYLMPLMAIIGLEWRGWWSPGSFYIAFVLIPVVEIFFKGTDKNLDDAQKELKSNQSFFNYLLYLNVPLLYFVLIYSFFVVKNNDFSRMEGIGMILNVGVVLGTLGINVAHELGHRQHKFDIILSKILLIPSFYMHFYIEHNLGHHKHIATPKDPATALLNENVYFFWIKSVFKSYLNAWKLEAKRLSKNNFSFWSFHNQMIQFVIIQVIYLIVIYYFGGMKCLIFLFLSGLVGILLLESVNYIEHYGLLRKIMSNGKYEPVMPKHSWNSNHELGRIFLYELTRHSDHHYKSTIKYQALSHHDESPQLPFGYPGAILIALIPPIWFSIMNKKVQEIA